MRKIEYKLDRDEYGMGGFCLTPCPISNETMAGSGMCIDFCNFNQVPGDHDTKAIYCTAPIRAVELHKGVRV